MDNAGQVSWAWILGLPAVSGALSLLGSYWGATRAFRTTVWQQRRHDYGQLMLAIESEEKDQVKRLNEIIRRLELVALVGSPRVSEGAEKILSESRDNRSTLTGRPPTWRKEMFDLMRQDVQAGTWRGWFRRCISPQAAQNAPPDARKTRA